MPVIGPPPAGTSVSLRLVAGTTSKLDLTQYLILQEGEGFDPADGDFLQPVFNDSSIGAGQGLVNIDTQNKEFQFPLHLKSATKDGLHTLIRTLRLKLSEPGVLVEWRDQGATDVTYHDLEFGRFDPDYKFHRARHNWVRGNLRCWCRPYGHTATERIAGTGAGSGFMRIVSVPSVAGDVGAQLVCDISSASRIRDLYGLSVIPSGMVTEWPAASLLEIETATLVGASGANASQYRAAYAHTTNTLLVYINLPQTGRVGGQRVLALARTPNLAGAYLSLDRSDAATAFLSATYRHRDDPIEASPTGWHGWQLVDLGVIPMAHASMRAATQIVALTGRLASYAAGSLMASPGLHINTIYVVPEDKTAIILDPNSDRLARGRARLDGLLNESYDYNTAGRTYTSGQRGAIPAVSPGEQVAAFALGIEANDGLSATVRIRERFSFSR